MLLPEDLRDMRAEQREGWVVDFTKRSLKWLRNWQKVNLLIRKGAFDWLNANRGDPRERELSNCDIKAEIVREAIDRREFPK